MTQASAPTRAAIYARISGASDAAIARQTDDCRALIEGHGWQATEVFIDQGLTAFRAAPRPAYQRLRHAIAAGQLDVVVSWHPDRLHRNVVELEAFIELAAATGVRMATTMAGEADLTLPADRFGVRVVGVIGAYESEQMGERRTRARRHAAERGAGPAGVRPFGYRRLADGTMVLVEGEAEIVGEVADRILAGESLGAITRSLNDRCVPTVLGRPWARATVRTMVTSPRMSGASLYEGKIVGEGRWPPILDEAQRLRVMAALAGRAGPRWPPSSTGCLLAARLVRCGRCAGPLRTCNLPTGSARYFCPPRVEGGCNGISMVAHRLDAQVTAAVLDRLDDPEAPWPADLDGDAAAVALGETSVRLAELDGIFRGDEISPAEHRRARTVLLERKATAVRRVQVVERGRPAAGRIRHTWPSLTTSARREVIARLAHRIVVHPASTPDRLEIEWKQ